ncbi:D-alanyl-D-alanine carboxypeptidase family protein [Halobacteroides halobius]|uniref:D-alanyl-D-alanine carboxypeptidase family protein n=1 Tax=Halobacteroides halobius TaxID=42422 RepID=UPI0002D7BB2F|nr:D-alanyl-D-alanine carboxypeptidase family protein [Halobacteroides halobius]
MFDLKKVVILILIVVLSSLPAYAQGVKINAKSAVLMDAQTGQVLFSKNKNLELPPASITKIMTILLTMEAVDANRVSLDDKVTVSSLAESMGGSQIWLAAGEKLTLKELLKAVIIPSANDACVALAEYIGGTERNFVRMMNQKAKELGLKHTNFINSTGLPVDHGKHYSSAYDIALMARELITKHKKVLKWTSKRVDYIKNGTIPLYTTNDLIGYYPDANGLKTGWTEEAGYCLAGTATRGETTLIAVVMGTKSDKARVAETAKLLDYGFNAFHTVRLINAGVEVNQVKVKKGKKLKVPVETAREFSALIKLGTKDQVKRKFKINEKLIAPVKKGAVVGKVLFLQQGKKLGEVKLITTKEVKKAGFFTIIFRWLKNFVMSYFNK